MCKKGEDIGGSMKMMVCALLLATAGASAQVELREAARVPPPPFDVDAISFASDSAGYSRLDIFAAISYEQLSFVKEQDAFQASYEMTVTVYDSARALVLEKLWTRNVKAASFDQSVSASSYSIETVSMHVRPGQYLIVVIARDLETRVSRRVNKQIRISDYDKEGLHLSDIMLLSRFAETGGKRTITPSISQNLGLVSGEFHVFFEAYNAESAEGMKFVTSVLNEKKQPVIKRDTTLKLKAGKNHIFLRVDHSSLPIGDYNLYIQAYVVGAETAAASTNRSFVIRWSGMPASLRDLDQAIDQLVYIAKDKELSHIKEAETPEEKQKRFLEFWKKRDPNPNTPRNEKMEEHYARVEYSNRHFKHYIEGWRTDMGMVYIRFGPPSNIDRHPFDIDSKPYEVWSYYDLNYSFVFVDQTGFGDYRLITPIWDVWERTRN